MTMLKCTTGLIAVTLMISAACTPDGSIPIPTGDGSGTNSGGGGTGTGGSGGSGGGGSTGGGGSSGTSTPPPRPSVPDPADGERNVVLESRVGGLCVYLDWAMSNATDYDVYLEKDWIWTSQGPGRAWSSYGGSDTWMCTMAYDTTYFWKVVAKNPAGTTEGPVWSFTTGPAPGGGGGGGGTSEQLTEGVHSYTLQAAEAKRYRLPLRQGQTAIVNTSVQDNATDVDLFAYAPSGTQPVASSTHNAGLPDNVHFVAATSGDYAVEVVNIAGSRAASFSMDYQKLPANSESASALNGVYRILQSNGQSIGESMAEWWVFANGSLTSYYGWLRGADFGLSEDIKYWVDARTGAVTAVHTQGMTLSVRIIQANTTQNGSATQLNLHIGITATDGADSASVDQTYAFSGQVGSGGQSLTGNVHNVVSAEGATIVDWTGSITLGRE